MVARRCAGEPLQYVLGRWPFRGLDLMVDRRVLIPRPETEEVVGWAVDAARRLLAEVRPPRHRPVAIDLGTGSGAIALSVARELGAQVWATDVSAEALDVASANLSGLGMWAATRVRIVQGSWWAALPADLRGQVDLVVSNPPYVADDEPLPDEVDRHEPAVALRAGADGLAAITEILAGMAGWLAPSGVAVIELAPHQAGRVVALARDAGARSAEVRVDGAGRARALVASW
jgi:release factor glutamine methyltransferase